MKGIWYLAAAVCTACSLAFAFPANAATFVFTGTGEVTETVNDLGLFGGGDLAGKSFEVVIAYDTELGVRATDADSDEIGTTIASNPILSFTFSIDGISYIPVLTTAGLAIVDTTLAFGGFWAEGSSLFNLTSPSIVPNLETEFALPVTGSGYFFVNDGDLYTDVGLSLTSASIVAVGIPEPTTWALMILGFGAVGALLRRKRAVPVLLH